MPSEAAIKTIKRVSRRDRYDLTVNTTHNFFANGVLIHNTSGRTSRTTKHLTLPKHKQLWNDYVGKHIGLLFPSTTEETVSGTRRTILKPGESDSFHGGDYRTIVQKYLDGRLHSGETIYYEIVGFTDQGASIMPSHTVDDKELVKQYGTTMNYKYGCDVSSSVLMYNPLARTPDGFTVPGRFRVLLYRVTQSRGSSKPVDMPFTYVQRRAEELGLETVVLLHRQIGTANLLEVAKTLAEGPDPLDPSHIQEGVCVLVEHKSLNKAFKLKSYGFTLGEGIKYHGTEEAVDPEDCA